MAVKHGLPLYLAQLAHEAGVAHVDRLTALSRCHTSTETFAPSNFRLFLPECSARCGARASVSMGNRVGAACESAVSKLFRILSKYLKNLDEIRKNLCGFQSYMRGHSSAVGHPALGPPKPAWRWEHGILFQLDESVSARQL